MGHRFDCPSDVSPRAIEYLSQIRRPRGIYMCRFCRVDDLVPDLRIWPDVPLGSGRGSTAPIEYRTVQLLDRHVLAYHFPFVRYYSCDTCEDFACLNPGHGTNVAILIFHVRKLGPVKQTEGRSLLKVTTGCYREQTTRHQIQYQVL